MRLGMITRDLGTNSLGRAYALWLVFRHLGWDVRTRSYAGSGRIWAPLVDTEFAATCRRSPRRALAESFDGAELIIGLKPWPSTVNVAQRVAQELELPLMFDIDDPDLSIARAEWTARPLRTRWHLRHLTSSLDDLVRAEAAVARCASLVSNPFLLPPHAPAFVLPHIRLPDVPRVQHGPKGMLHVSFVGTPRSYKGLDLLRAAVSELGDRYHLTVTAERPPDARENETWLGQGPLERGLRLLANSDVVALPTRSGPAAEGQLPVKLIDAMLAGCAIVASDTPPMNWALGDTGILTRPDDLDDLTSALRTLHAAPDLRSELGTKARARAVSTFTPKVVAPALEAFLRREMDVAKPESQS